MTVNKWRNPRRVFTRLGAAAFAALLWSNGFCLNPAAAFDAQPLTAATVNPISAVPSLDLAGLLGTIGPNEITFEPGFHPNLLASAVFDLVQYMKNNIDPRPPADVLAAIPKYKRLEMFGTWVNESEPSDCYNTRAEVLLRDARPGSKISFSPANPCQVAKGDWSDPYSGADFKLASAVQIDHVVPLKNAYRSGAHAWTNERRCHYANFLIDKQHLLAVSGRENMSKGDRGPEGYLPSDDHYTCEYVTNWVRIKAVWGLTFSQDEEIAIEKVLRDHRCSIPATQLPLPDFQKIRATTVTLNAKCGVAPVGAP